MEENYLEGLYIGTVFEKGYGQVSRSIMRDKSISKEAKVIYAYLMSFAGTKMEAFPSWKTICEELGFKSKDTYYKYIKELKEHGIVKVVQQKEKGKWAKNIYSLALRNEQLEEFKSFHKISETEKMGNGFSGNRFFSESNINIPLNINSSLNKEEKETLILKFKDVKNEIPSKYQIKCLIELCNDYEYSIVLKAIEVMAERANKPSISYLKTTLKDWADKGLNTIEKVLISIAEHEEHNKSLREAKRKNAKVSVSKGNKTDNFNNFPQRNYDFNKLEKGLLGIENVNIDDIQEV
jgi:DnaD/phage-associated family protein